MPININTCFFPFGGAFTINFVYFGRIQYASIKMVKKTHSPDLSLLIFFLKNKSAIPVLLPERL